MTLDEAVRVEDALDSIQRGFSKDIHVGCFKPECRDEQAAAYELALMEVDTFGSVRKAIKHVNAVICTYR